MVGLGSHRSRAACGGALAEDAAPAPRRCSRRPMMPGRFVAVPGRSTRTRLPQARSSVRPVHGGDPSEGGNGFRRGCRQRLHLDSTGCRAGASSTHRVEAGVLLVRGGPIPVCGNPGRMQDGRHEVRFTACCQPVQGVGTGHDDQRRPPTTPPACARTGPHRAPCGSPLPPHRRHHGSDPASRHVSTAGSGSAAARSPPQSNPSMQQSLVGARWARVLQEPRGLTAGLSEKSPHRRTARSTPPSNRRRTRCPAR